MIILISYLKEYFTLSYGSKITLLIHDFFNV